MQFQPRASKRRKFLRVTRVPRLSACLTQSVRWFTGI